MHRQLQDLQLASAYLTECLLDKEPKVFLIGLKHVIEAHGGMAKAAKAAQVNRESLYKALSEHGNPSLAYIRSILNAVGVRLEVATA